MEINVLFASVAVRDLGLAQSWYERFFERPADIVPNDCEVMWKATDSAWVYVIQDAARAGHSVVTMAVPHLEQAISALRGRNLVTGPIAQIGDAGHKAVVLDPDGNSISLIQVGGDR